MRKGTWIVAVAGLAAAATAVSAHPKDVSGGKQRPVMQKKFVFGGGPDTPTNFLDTFDTYTAGSGVYGQPGTPWQPWDFAGADCIVSTDQAFSGKNSMQYVDEFNDCIAPFDITGGIYVYRVRTYVPTGAVQIGQGAFLILMSEFTNGNPGDPREWNCQVRMDVIQGVINNDATGFDGPPELPLVKDQWVDYINFIDLENDSYRDMYAGQLLGSGVWTDSQIGNPLISTLGIECMDMYSDGIEPVYMDDIVLRCYADFDTSTGVGALDFFDFIGFQDAFSVGDPIACDADTSTGTGVCDFFDFIYFQDAFSFGCGT